jgi:hypothetical protein
MPLNQAVTGKKFRPALEAAVMKGLSRDPARRQPSVTDFAREFLAGVEGGDEPAAAGLLGTIRRFIGGQ